MLDETRGVECVRQFGQRLCALGIRERIERAEPSQLDRWAARLLTADNLEEVFER